ncbi:MAG: hydrogenase nickel incorporation protein HypB [Deltaproteobacteria bacterium]|nr:hydrogenase nickel incorporation protein HypB [Deltaproteobacteria bacterium]
MAGIRLIEVKEEILSDNTKTAGQIRERLRAANTLLLNLMSSPGSGKTSLLLRTIEGLKGSLRLGVIEADIDSVVDAEKVAARGIPAVQLRTGGFCHLDAAMVTRGIDALDIDKLDLVVIENVGNLVCPAEFDTGAHRNVMILSVPEGDDKPLKYPLMFSVCDLLLVNKIDFLSLSDFNMALLRERVLALNPRIKILEISCKTGAGIEDWIAWLKGEAAGFNV